MEGAVLGALQTHLMRADLIETFCEEYAQHLNELRAAQDSKRRSRAAELRRLEKRRDQVIQPIYNDIDPRMIRAESKYIANRMEELELEEARDQDAPPPKPLVHPTMAKRYRQEVENLRRALELEKTCESIFTATWRVF